MWRSPSRGVPAWQRVAMPMLELIGSLGTIASAHGVGRESTSNIASAAPELREVGEAPAAVLLHAAHKELRRASTSREYSSDSPSGTVQRSEYASDLH